MEINVAFAAALALRSRDALTAVGGATLLAIAVSAAWIWVAGRFSPRALSAATRAFAILFLAQLAMYALHESAEARLLPASDVLHAATEPYGPDGEYGRYFAWLLLVVPLLSAAVIRSRRWIPVEGRLVVPRRGAVTIACAAVIVVGGGLTLRPSFSASTVAPAADAAALAAGPHLLFRHTLVDAQYGSLSIASLADPGGRRASAGPACERVAFANDRGLCLQASRGVFTTYRAMLFDRAFKTIASWKLDGSPSRARVSPDGRVGAITVFVTGHAYGTSPFSTKTTLIDMASGDPLGELEQFSVWRGGARFKAADFNFWGVTFGRDSNTFYATLATAGNTYLVKGELGLRKLTVIHDGVECPSLSPDERLIAFKKRVAGTGYWRPYVLDLATMAERPIAAETRNIDDQMEWLDTGHVLYGLPRASSATTDVWVAPVDGSAQATVFAAGAESPIVVR